VLLGLAAIVALFTIVWLVSVRIENSSIADVAWGPGILILGLTYYLTADGFPLRARLTLALLAIWAIRLAAHLAWRIRNEGEDHRYVQWRDEREDSWWWFSYFKVFLLQAVLAWIVSAPIYFATVSLAPAALTLFDLLGVLAIAAGLVIEAVADEQLRRFRNHRTVALDAPSQLPRRSDGVVGLRPDRRRHRRLRRAVRPRDSDLLTALRFRRSPGRGQADREQDRVCELCRQDAGLSADSAAVAVV
jgi:steroid 5-alpha reductase family enzyme